MFRTRQKRPVCKRLKNQLLRFAYYRDTETGCCTLKTGHLQPAHLSHYSAKAVYHIGQAQKHYSGCLLGASVFYWLNIQWGREAETWLFGNEVAGDRPLPGCTFATLKLAQGAVPFFA